MIVSLSEKLQAAKKGKYAVGLFNVVSLEMMKSVFRAADDLNSYLKSLGFKYVTMDLGGYRMGSMNDTL